jgi:hypothetical protein
MTSQERGILDHLLAEILRGQHLTQMMMRVVAAHLNQEAGQEVEVDPNQEEEMMTQKINHLVQGDQTEILTILRGHQKDQKIVVKELLVNLEVKIKALETGRRTPGTQLKKSMNNLTL